MISIEKLAGHKYHGMDLSNRWGRTMRIDTLLTLNFKEGVPVDRVPVRDHLHARPEQHNQDSGHIEDEMKRSYMDYAHVGHPAGRSPTSDGLKPVHRRCLFAMYPCGNDYNKPYRKIGPRGRDRHR